MIGDVEGKSAASLVFCWQMDVIFALTTSTLHGEVAGLAGEVPSSSTQESIALFNFGNAGSEFRRKNGGRGQSSETMSQHVDEYAILGDRISKGNLWSVDRRYMIVSWREDSSQICLGILKRYRRYWSATPCGGHVKLMDEHESGEHADSIYLSSITARIFIQI